MVGVVAKLYAFLKLSRAAFLMGGVVMYALGAAAALHQGYAISVEKYLWGQLIVTFTQMMTQFSNEYFDYESDKLNRTYTYWSGGSRVLPKGELPIKTALIAALGCGGAAFVLGLALALSTQDILLVILLLAAMILAWGYSSPPLRLHSRSLGELTSSLVVAILTPTVGFYVQTGSFSGEFLLATIPISFLQFNVLLGVHFPDAEGDQQAGKITLVVRYGRQATAYLYGAMIFAAYFSLPILMGLGLAKTVGLAVLLSAPFAIFLLWRVARRDWENPQRWGWLAFFSIALLMTAAALEIAAFLIEAEFLG